MKKKHFIIFRFSLNGIWNLTLFDLDDGNFFVVDPSPPVSGQSLYLIYGLSSILDQRGYRLNEIKVDFRDQDN